MRNRSGKLIAFCGIDGSGKSTQINLLCEHLVSNDVETVVLKQPTAWYRDNTYVRRRVDENDKSISPYILALLSATDRLIQTDEVISPLLREGKTVLMDRYVYSAYAYLQARGVYDLQWLVEINKFHVAPDHVIYLDIDPSEALLRIIRRDGGSSKREEQDVEFMTQVRENYLRAIREAGFEPYDATDEPGTIHKKIIQRLGENLTPDVKSAQPWFSPGGKP
jgi:dTMP kinase